MEHSHYSESPSPSSSLINFPTPTNLQDIRLHRPFSQMHDLKHLHLPFQGANFGFRFMENYSALPAHILNHLQPPFVHPALDPRLSSFSQAAGVFQPLSQGSPNPAAAHHYSQHSNLKGFASAFAPPSKCYKTDAGASKPSVQHAAAAAADAMTAQQQPPPGLQQQLRQSRTPPSSLSSSFPPYTSRISPGSPVSISPPSSSSAAAAAANAHRQHVAARDECSDSRDTSSSDDGRTTVRRKKPSPPAIATTPTATVSQSNSNNNNNNNNNNSSSSNNNNNNNSGSIKQSSAVGQQQQQQQQSPAATAACCPVCGATLRTAHELESHFVWELERLYKQAAAAGRRHRRDDKSSDHHHLVQACGGRDGSPVSGNGSLHGRWETYQKVKANRHNRLRIKNRKRKPDEMMLAPTACCCPVCNEPVAASTQEQMNAHVEMCLRNKGHPMTALAANDEEDETVDVEGDTDTTMYDMVYTGAGWSAQQVPHNRMRQQQSMMLHGGAYNRGVAAIPISSGPPRQPTGGGENAVLVVDDAYKYGPNQYEDRDVIVPSRPPTASSDGRRLTPSEQNNDPNAMETAESACGENVGPLDVSIKKENAVHEDGTVAKASKMDVDKFCGGQYGGNNRGQVVEALKARIRELELVSKTGGDKFTLCVLCKGHFKDPVVSTSCWHVYCEVCWLQILGAKKLCPQCYVITLPSQLRRVYL